MNDQDDNVPQPLKEMIRNSAGGRITIDRQTPPRLGWRSARVTVSTPDAPGGLSFVVHWREPSRCYAGFRKFSRPETKPAE
jgi:hypothetical protein